MRFGASLILSFLAGTTWAAAPGLNLLENGGFEVVAKDGKPSGWDCRTAICEVVNKHALEGERCLEMLPRESDSYVWSKPIPVAVGARLKVSVAMRHERTNPETQPGVVATFVVLDAKGQQIKVLETLRGDTWCMSSDLPSGQWRRFSAEGFVPQGATHLHVGLTVWHMRTGSVFWDDAVVTVEKEKARQVVPSALYRFDFEDAAGQTFPGFQRVTDADLYQAARGYGWIVPKGATLKAVTQITPAAQVRKPDPLANDFCFASGAQFRIDLPSGKYKVWMVIGDIGRCWAEHGLDWRQGHEVKVDGKRVAYRAPYIVKNTPEEHQRYMNEWFFRDYWTQYRRGEDLWERYVEPMFPTYLFDAEVKARSGGGRGELVLDFYNAPLGGMVIFPESAFGKVDEELKALKAARKSLFPFQEIPYIREARMADLTAQERARGYVVYPRHHLDEVVLDTLPPRAQIGTKLRAFLSRNQYEPMTFGLYAAKELKGVKVTLPCLVGPEKAKIQGDDIEIRMARIAPIVYQQEYRVMPHILQPFKEAEVQADTSQWFWITVHAGKDLPPGIYRGTAMVAPSNADPLALDVAVKVLPITLKDGMRCAMNNVLLSVAIPYGGKYEGEHEQLLRMFQRHNTAPFYFNTWEVATPGTFNKATGKWENLSFDELDNYLRFLQRVGIKLPFLNIAWDPHRTRTYLYGLLGKPEYPGIVAECAKADPLGHPFDRAWGDLVRALKKHMEDHPELYPKDIYWSLGYFSDASDGTPPDLLAKAMEAVTARTGVTRFLSGGIYRAHVVAELKKDRIRDLLLFGGGGGITREEVAIIHAKGGRTGYSNVGGLSVSVRWAKGDPFTLSFYRLIHGIIPWSYKLDAMQDEGGWNEGGMPYNPFDYVPWFHDGFDLKTKVTISPDGFVPLICYEATRQGTDDLRYAELMMDLAQEAETTGNEKAKAAAARCGPLRRKWRSGFPRTSSTQSGRRT